MQAPGHDQLTLTRTEGESMIHHSPAPEKIPPGQGLLLRTEGACDLDPAHLLEVCGPATAPVRRGPARVWPR